jgi:8-oxo-dGTP pyrophosphatase MutT (NUDIX family)
VVFDEDKNPWQTLSSREVYENSWIKIREDEIVRPDGEPGIYGVVHYKNIAIGILPIEDGHIYLVGQHRYPLEQYSWEIPEGGCAEGEDLLAAAQRELAEETGLRAANWKLVGEAHLSNSVSDERAVWFQATSLTQGEPEPEGTEQLNIQRLPGEQVLRMALSGEITDALSLLAIMSYQLTS